MTDTTSTPRQRRARLEGIALLVYLGGSLIAWIIFRDVQAVQTVVIALTGVAVIWSALESIKLREAARAQLDTQLDATELAHRPLVLLAQLRERDVIFLQNIGSSPALNVRILPAELQMGSDDDDPVILEFPGSIPILAGGQLGSLKVDGKVFGVSMGDFFNAALDPEIATHPVTITICYENLQMKSYKVSQLIEPGSLSTVAITVTS